MVSGQVERIGDAVLYCGDCLDVLPTLDAESVDSIVTDPPAGIAFMGKDWDKDKGGRKEWIVWMSKVAAECIRVMKPGGHALVWAIPRTSHWTGMAWENAGWMPRDKIYHVFGSGFPKSLDASKAIDKAAGAERDDLGPNIRRGDTMPYPTNASPDAVFGGGITKQQTTGRITAPATPEAQQWDGWGTGLKPAVEEWWLFRKPLSEGTVAANVLKWGTGAINVDACRVEGEKGVPASLSSAGQHGWRTGGDMERKSQQNGRFPANFIHDGSDEVTRLFPREGRSAKASASGRSTKNNGASLTGMGGVETNPSYFDTGSAARFFYVAKSSKADRDEGCEGMPKQSGGMVSNTSGQHVTRREEGYEVAPRANNHPTVKPTDLMRYLVRLVTPPGGVVLDPFAGSGSTGKACAYEEFRFIGIELAPEYMEIAKARIGYAQAQPKQGELFESELFDPTELASTQGELTLDIGAEV